MCAYIADPLEDHVDKPAWLPRSEQTPSHPLRIRPLPPPPVRGRPPSPASDTSSVPSLYASGSSAGSTSPPLSPRSSLRTHRGFSSPVEPLPSPWSSLDAPIRWQPSPRSSLLSEYPSRTTKLRALPLPPDRPALVRSKTTVDNYSTPVKSPAWSTAATEDAPSSASLWISRSPHPRAHALQRAQSDAMLSPRLTLSSPRQAPASLGREQTIRRQLPSLPESVRAPVTAPSISLVQAQQAAELVRKRTLRRRGVVGMTGLGDAQTTTPHFDKVLPPIPLL